MLEQDARLQAILANAPGSRLIKPGEVIPPQQEDPKEVREHLEGLAMARRDMDMTERIAKAEETKAQANAHFGSGKWKVSMVGYLAAIWFLKRGSPKCPTMVASETRGMDEVASVQCTAYLLEQLPPPCLVVHHYLLRFRKAAGIYLGEFFRDLEKDDHHFQKNQIHHQLLNLLPLKSCVEWHFQTLHSPAYEEKVQARSLQQMSRVSTRL